MSMAVNSILLTVQELTSQRVWNTREGLVASYQYSEAQQIVQLLRDDVTMFGVLEILTALGSGKTFEEAYGAIPGRRTDFAASVAERIRAQGTTRFPLVIPYPRPPGIDFAPDSVAGPGAEGPTFVLWGFAPNSSVTLFIRGAATGFTNGSRSVVVDQYGVYWNRLGTSWPADTYEFTVTNNNGVTIRKSITKTN
jgi:hypothetical protein